MNYSSQRLLLMNRLQVDCSHFSVTVQEGSRSKNSLKINVILILHTQDFSKS